jgi:hypothetical protein
MTASTKTIRFVSLGDRFAELSVVILTVIALALGAWLKSGVENRSLAFSNAGITAQTPAGWLITKASGEEVLRVTDRTSSGFGTTYTIQQNAVAADAELGQVVSMLTLDRGTSLTAYRVLKQQDVTVAGRKGVEIEYVYVESAANLTHAVLPVVVHGLDYVFVENGKAVIVGYQAAQSAFDTDLGRFLRFLVSVKF